MLDINMIVALLALGMVAGLLAGLLGVGGGTVIVPVLVWILHSRPEISPSSIMHVALASSLATIMFTSVSSVIAHHRRGAIVWPVALRLTPGLVIGVLVGSAIAGSLSGRTLKMVFSVFLLIISAQLGFSAQPAAHRQLPKLSGTSLAGFIIGNVSALVGIGGGTLIVPFLVWCNVAIRNAVATSAACGFPIAVAGTIGYVISGWHENLAMSTGYVYWPAVIAIVSTSLFTALLGAKLAHSVPVGVLKKFFAVFLAVVGVKMLVG
jgi:uncharacterized protein